MNILEMKNNHCITVDAFHNERLNLGRTVGDHMCVEIALAECKYFQKKQGAPTLDGLSLNCQWSVTGAHKEKNCANATAINEADETAFLEKLDKL